MSSFKKKLAAELERIKATLPELALPEEMPEGEKLILGDLKAVIILLEDCLAVKSRQQFKTSLANFLARRWQLIAGSALAYTVFPNTEATQLCLMIARYLQRQAPDKKVLTRLMPSLCEFQDTYRTDMDIDAYSLDLIILTEDRRAIIPVVEMMQMVTPDQGLTDLYRPYCAADCQAAPRLTLLEQEGIAAHNPVHRQLVDILREIEFLRSKQGALYALYQGLKAGSIDRQAGGTGADDCSSAAADEAIISFMAFFNQLDADRQKALDQLADANGNSFFKVRKNLTEPGAGKTVAERCVNENANMLQAIINNNPQIFPDQKALAELLVRFQNQSKLLALTDANRPALQGQDQKRPGNFIDSWICPKPLSPAELMQIELAFMRNSLADSSQVLLTKAIPPDTNTHLQQFGRRLTNFLFESQFLAGLAINADLDPLYSKLKVNNDGQALSSLLNCLMLTPKGRKIASRWFNTAIVNLEVEWLDLFLQAGMKPEKKKYADKSALDVAISVDNPEILRQLLNATPMLSEKDKSQLLLAAIKGSHLKIIPQLVAYGARLKSTACETSAITAALDITSSEEARRAALIALQPFVQFEMNLYQDDRLECGYAVLVMAKSGDFDLAKGFLHLYVDLQWHIKESTFKGYTALHFALKAERLDFFVQLLRFGAKPEVSYFGTDSVLTMAVSAVQSAFLQAILSSSTVSQARLDELLFLAIDKHQAKSIALLLQHGASLEALQDKKTPVQKIEANKDWEGLSVVGDYLQTLKTPYQQEAANLGAALHWATYNGKYDLALKFIHPNVSFTWSFNRDGLTCLHLAVSARQYALVKVMLRAGADFMYRKAEKLPTSLDLAVEMDDVEILKLFYFESLNPENKLILIQRLGKLRHWNFLSQLVSQILSPEATTPLQVEQHQEALSQILLRACKYQQSDLANLILASDCKLNLCAVKKKSSRPGYTALHWAIQHGDGELVGRLLARGADVNFKLDDNSLSPLHLALWVDNMLILDQLCKNNTGVTEIILFKRLQLAITEKRSNALQYFLQSNPVLCQDSVSILDVATQAPDAVILATLVNYLKENPSQIGEHLHLNSFFLALLHMRQFNLALDVLQFPAFEPDLPACLALAEKLNQSAIVDVLKSKIPVKTNAYTFFQPNDAVQPLEGSPEFGIAPPTGHPIF